MDISFVIVEYCDTDILSDAVQSIFDKIQGLEYQIIVVSNSNYNQNKQNELQANLPNCFFIFSQTNLGFGKAVNQGIKGALGKYIVLLNPDAKLLNNGLSDAINFMSSRPKSAVLGPAVIDKSGDFQDSCRDFMTPWILFKRTIKRMLGIATGAVLEKRNLNSPQLVDWLSGSCMMLRKAAIEEVGLIDERYFMYAEDMDWCRSFSVNGWGVWFFPMWKIEHNASRDSSSKLFFSNKLMWIHLHSLLKYYLKWSFTKST